MCFYFIFNVTHIGENYPLYGVKQGHVYFNMDTITAVSKK